MKKHESLEMQQMKVELARTYKRIRPISTNEIMKAKKKPLGCSDIRWRIELRRRMNTDYYATAGALV